MSKDFKTEARAKGDTILKKALPEEHKFLMDKMRPFCKEMSDAVIDHAYGTIWARDELSKRMRSIITVTSLAAIGGCERFLRSHIEAALRNRCTVEELRETFLHIHLYVGLPRAQIAMNILREVVVDMGGGKELKDFESDPLMFVPEEQKK